ncbi:hypothetical protein [Neorhizobium sp. P12A]|uniref:hypothetical protein n=1 Tax=Neorhizobium sp. P12A TaxID=2268027 RepID=UPI00165DB430|nr:hypothetical protein [Neorhizobium sp. P12A]
MIEFLKDAAIVGGCVVALVGALLALAACVRSSEITREEERGYLFDEEQSGASEGAWPR